MKTPRAVMDAVNTRAPIPTHARTALEVLLVILAVAAAAWVLYRLQRLLFVLALGMFLAYVVAPLVRFAQHLRVSDGGGRQALGQAVFLELWE